MTHLITLPRRHRVIAETMFKKGWMRLTTVHAAEPVRAEQGGLAGGFLPLCAEIL